METEEYQALQPEDTLEQPVDSTNNAEAINPQVEPTVKTDNTKQRQAGRQKGSDQQALID